MPFLIFFLVGGFDKSVLVGEVHVCEVPQQLGCVVVSVAVLTKEVADEVPFDYRLLCVRQFGNDFIRCFSSNAKGWSLMPKSGKCLL